MSKRKASPEPIPVVLDSGRIFDPQQRQETIEDSFYHQIHPSRVIQTGEPIDLCFKSDKIHATDLSKTKLYVKFKLTAANGTNLANNVRVAPISYPVGTMFDRVETYLNDVRVGDDKHYGFKSYIEALLSTEEAVKKGQLTSGLFFLDDANQFENTLVVAAPNTDRNSGFVARQAFTDQSASVDLLGRIHSDIFKSRRLLPPGVDLRVTLYPAQDKFTLLAHTDANTSKLVIQDAAIFLHQVKLTAMSESYMVRKLQSTNAIYPISRATIRVHHLVQNTTEFRIENFIRAEKLPDAIVIGFTRTSALQGDITQNPLKFEKHTLDRLVLHVNDKRYPRQASTDNMELWNFMSLYDNDIEGNGLGRKEHPYGYFLTKFQINNVGEDYVSGSKSGQINIEGNFSTALTAGVTMVVFIEQSGVLEIDGHLRPSVR